MAEIFTEEFLEQIANRAADIVEQRANSKAKSVVKDPEKTFSARDVAKMVTLDVQTIRVHAKIGLIEGKKTGLKWAFTMEAVNKYIGKNE